MKLQGIFVAAATPFDANGEIYKVKVEHNVVRWNRTSVSGYAFGTPAGEGPLLREEEKVALWEMGAKHAAEGKLLIADCSAAGVHISASLAKRAADIGFHAVICSAPRYTDLVAQGFEASLYLRSVADRSPLPIIAADVLPEDMEQVAAHPNIAAIVGRSIADDPAHLFESFEQGASAALLSLASAVPYAAITVWEAFRTREREAGLDWQNRLAGLEIAKTGGVGALKYAMELMGYYGGPPRLPFCPPNAAMRAAIEDAFHDMRG